jgi:lysozyme family protein
MADFEIAHKITLKFEGGYTNHPDDNGNWTGGKKGNGNLIGTNHGISAPLLKEYLGYIPAVGDMKQLTPEAAKKIYKKIFWDKIKGDFITSQEIANNLYDSAVNMGVTQAVLLAQRTLQVAETGKMSIELLSALNNNKSK